MKAFYLKKLAASAILPPGIFIIVLAVGGLYLLRRSKGMGSLLLLSALCLYGFSIEPTKDFLMRPLEDAFPLNEETKGDVLIMLGGGTYSGVPDLGGKGSPSEDAIERMVCTYRLWRRLQVPVIVSGGRLVQENPPEAEIVGRILRDMGIPGKYLIEEGRSKDTGENSRYVKKVMEKKGFKRPVLITSAYHLRRAVLNFREAGIGVIPFPCVYETSRGRYAPVDFMPNAASLDGSAKALKEYLGIAAHKIRIFTASFS